MEMKVSQAFVNNFYYIFVKSIFKKNIMKPSLSLMIAAILLALTSLMSSFENDSTSYPGGAPPGYTNSPGDKQNCGHCMGADVTNVSGWISSNIPPTGYVPGSTYTIELNVTGSGNKGFEISPQDTSGNLIGILTAGAANHLVGSGKYVTHDNSDIGILNWSFSWTAPNPGVGDVNFYAAFWVEHTQLSTYTVSENTNGVSQKSQLEVALFPDPAKDHVTLCFNHATSGNVVVEMLKQDGRKIGDIMYEFVQAGPFFQSFPISLSKGIYLVRIISGKQEAIRKLIVE